MTKNDFKTYDDNAANEEIIRHDENAENDKKS